jgi:hypothetical protein
MLVIIADHDTEVTAYMREKADIVIYKGNVDKVPNSPEDFVSALACVVVTAVTQYLSARSRSARRSNNGV